VAWFDDPSLFFADANDRTISQGDIVIAPTVVVVSGVSDNDVAAPADIDIERRVTLWHGNDDVVLPGAPSLSADVRWGPTMVLPHPCALEKEWNEKVDELVSAGEDQHIAEERATAMGELDPYVVIAPIVSYEGFSEKKAESIRGGDYLSTFPIAPTNLFPSVYVDLNRATTCEWRLIPHEARVARLSKLAIGHLRHRVCAFYAYRSNSKLGDIESAIGQTIVGVHAVAKAKSLTVGLVLANGETLTLRGDPRPETHAGPVRPERK